MKKKKITAIAIIVAMLAIAVVGGTMAYFTDTDKATNTFVQGNVKIDVKEIGPDGVTVSDDAEYTGVTPGIEMSKQPYVVNIGSNDALVRMDVTLNKYAAFKTAAAVHGITDLADVFSGHNPNSWYRFQITEDVTADTVTYSYLYGYYDGTTFTPSRIAKDEETAKLFTGVTVPAVFTSTELEAIGNFSIVVDGFAIQADLDASAGGLDTLVAELKAMTK